MRNANGREERARQDQGGLFAEERQHAIEEQLRQKGKVTVEELARRFRVSPPTVRADLTRLEEQGLLRRTHGGAIALGNTLYEPPYAERAVLHQAEKRAIARAAVALVHEGETLLLDAGTTCHEIALCLRGFRRLTVVTNSLASAQALAENDGIETILIGGTVQARRQATLGALAAHFLDPIQCDRAFVAVSGVHPASGFTVVDFDAAEVKRKMLEKGKQAIVVADSSKVGQVAFASVGPLTSAHLLLTDADLRHEDRLALEEAGLHIHCAD
ncbi:MAG TPA: DeoR/GlpR family DNA-binding transcription regulator [Chthonomonadaceae bacterium]|nr:DeoR/GlpR family DNA-binding transcription regulator [Chthonomonadaceae bacterium]